MRRRATIAVLVLLSGCATNRAPESTMDSTSLREAIVSRPAVERVVATTVPSTTTTTVTTTTVSPTTTVPQGTHRLTAEQAAIVYTDNGPLEWAADQITDEDLELFDIMCDELANGHALGIVKTDFINWFLTQMRNVGAPEEHVNAWHPAGIFDDVIAASCPLPTTTPA